jgi:hypothetical protein
VTQPVVDIGIGAGIGIGAPDGAGIGAGIGMGIDGGAGIGAGIGIWALSCEPEISNAPRAINETTRIGRLRQSAVILTLPRLHLFAWVDPQRSICGAIAQSLFSNRLIIVAPDNTTLKNSSIHSRIALAT